MKLWIPSTLFAVSVLIFSGCSQNTPKPANEVTIDSSLPVVELTQNGVFADMNAIAFEWKNITDPRVEGIYVYKRVFDPKTTQSGDDKESYYDTIKGRFATHYYDNNIKPDTKYSYFFKTYSKTAESKRSRIITINSLPVLQSVSWIHSIQGLPRSAKIIWRPHTSKKVKEYIIERKTLEDEEWKKLATLKGRFNAEYIDTDLKDNYVYKYRIRVVTFDGIVSTPSEIVKVVTKSLPKPITDIVATKNLPKEIKLDWNKSTDKDFARYYVYRSDEIDGKYELVAKLYNNTFVDKIKEDGKSYFYRVSQVDKDSLESKHSQLSVHGMSLEKPNAPAIVDAKIVGNSIEIVWSKVDPRTTSYTLVRKAKKGWFDSVTTQVDGIKNTKYKDSDIAPQTTYFYKIYAVDKNNIISKPSIEIKIKSNKAGVVKTTTKKAPQEVQEVQQQIDKNTQTPKGSDEGKIIPNNDF